MSTQSSKAKKQIVPHSDDDWSVHLGALIDTLQDLDEDDRLDAIDVVRDNLHEIFPIQQPIDAVKWVDIDMVSPNDYNPNAVARQEMSLLYKSILHDGYTQPVVTIYDPELEKYVIIDGFHRYFTCKTQNDIYKRNKGKLPIVVLKKDINERMSATVRHNRARGEHSVKGMANMVFQMLENGMTESEICDHLGMSAEEILKLKHITGFSKLFADAEYRKAWETTRQIKLRKTWEEENQEA